MGGTNYEAANSWYQIVRGQADPNGEIEADGTGADIYIDWNFDISKPENNKGLLRHELLHGLGMQGYTSLGGLPTMTAGTRNVVQSSVTSTSAMVHDRYIYDLNNDPILGSYVSGVTYNLNKPIAVDNDWEDANRSGLYFKGINDDGSERKIWLDAKNSTDTQDGTIDVHHPREVSYNGVLPDGGTVEGLHPTWNTVEEVDRAYLRGLGYTIVPEPSSLLLAGIALSGLAFSRKR